MDRMKSVAINTIDLMVKKLYTTQFNNQPRTQNLQIDNEATMKQPGILEFVNMTFDRCLPYTRDALPPENDSMYPQSYGSHNGPFFPHFMPLPPNLPGPQHIRPMQRPNFPNQYGYNYNVQPEYRPYQHPIQVNSYISGNQRRMYFPYNSQRRLNNRASDRNIPEYNNSFVTSQAADSVRKIHVKDPRKNRNTVELPSTSKENARSILDPRIHRAVETRLENRVIENHVPVTPCTERSIDFEKEIDELNSNNLVIIENELEIQEIRNPYANPAAINRKNISNNQYDKNASNSSSFSNKNITNNLTSSLNSCKYVNSHSSAPDTKTIQNTSLETWRDYAHRPYSNPSTSDSQITKANMSIKMTQNRDIEICAQEPNQPHTNIIYDVANIPLPPLKDINNTTNKPNDLPIDSQNFEHIFDDSKLSQNDKAVKSNNSLTTLNKTSVIMNHMYDKSRILKSARYDTTKEECKIEKTSTPCTNASESYSRRSAIESNHPKEQTPKSSAEDKSEKLQNTHVQDRNPSSSTQDLNQNKTAGNTLSPNKLCNEIEKRPLTYTNNRSTYIAVSKANAKIAQTLKSIKLPHNNVIQPLNDSKESLASIIGSKLAPETSLLINNTVNTQECPSTDQTLHTPYPNIQKLNADSVVNDTLSSESNKLDNRTNNLFVKTYSRRDNVALENKSTVNSELRQDSVIQDFSATAKVNRTTVLTLVPENNNDNTSQNNTSKESTYVNATKDITTIIQLSSPLTPTSVIKMLPSSNSERDTAPKITTDRSVNKIQAENENITLTVSQNSDKNIAAFQKIKVIQPLQNFEGNVTINKIDCLMVQKEGIDISSSKEINVNDSDVKKYDQDEKSLKRDTKEIECSRKPNQEIEIDGVSKSDTKLHNDSGTVKLAADKKTESSKLPPNPTVIKFLKEWDVEAQEHTPVKSDESDNKDPIHNSETILNTQVNSVIKNSTSSDSLSLTHEVVNENNTGDVIDNSTPKLSEMPNREKESDPVIDISSSGNDELLCKTEKESLNHDPIINTSSFGNDELLCKTEKDSLNHDPVINVSSSGNDELLCKTEKESLNHNPIINTSSSGNDELLCKTEKDSLNHDPVINVSSSGNDELSCKTEKNSLNHDPVINISSSDNDELLCKTEKDSLNHDPVINVSSSGNDELLCKTEDSLNHIKVTPVTESSDKITATMATVDPEGNSNTEDLNKNNGSKSRHHKCDNSSKKASHSRLRYVAVPKEGAENVMIFKNVKKPHKSKHLSKHEKKSSRRNSMELFTITSPIGSDNIDKHQDIQTVSSVRSDISDTNIEAQHIDEKPTINYEENSPTKSLMDCDDRSENESVQSACAGTSSPVNVDKLECQKSSFDSDSRKNKNKQHAIEEMPNKRCCTRAMSRENSTNNQSNDSDIYDINLYNDFYTDIEEFDGDYKNSTNKSSKPKSNKLYKAKRKIAPKKKLKKIQPVKSKESATNNTNIEQSTVKKCDQEEESLILDTTTHGNKKKECSTEPNRECEIDQRTKSMKIDAILPSLSNSETDQSQDIQPTYVATPKSSIDSTVSSENSDVKKPVRKYWKKNILDYPMTVESDERDKCHTPSSGNSTPRLSNSHIFASHTNTRELNDDDKNIADNSDVRISDQLIARESSDLLTDINPQAKYYILNDTTGELEYSKSCGELIKPSIPDQALKSPVENIVNTSYKLHELRKDELLYIATPKESPTDNQVLDYIKLPPGLVIKRVSPKDLAKKKAENDPESEDSNRIEIMKINIKSPNDQDIKSNSPTEHSKSSFNSELLKLLSDKKCNLLQATERTPVSLSSVPINRNECHYSGMASSTQSATNKSPMSRTAIDYSDKKIEKSNENYADTSSQCNHKVNNGREQNINTEPTCLILLKENMQIPTREIFCGRCNSSVVQQISPIVSPNKRNFTQTYIGTPIRNAESLDSPNYVILVSDEMNQLHAADHSPRKISCDSKTAPSIRSAAQPAQILVADRPSFRSELSPIVPEDKRDNSNDNNVNNLNLTSQNHNQVKNLNKNIIIHSNVLLSPTKKFNIVLNNDTSQTKPERRPRMITVPKKRLFSFESDMNENSQECLDLNFRPNVEKNSNIIEKSDKNVNTDIERQIECTPTKPIDIFLKNTPENVKSNNSNNEPSPSINAMSMPNDYPSTKKNINIIPINQQSPQQSPSNTPESDRFFEIARVPLVRFKYTPHRNSKHPNDTWNRGPYIPFKKRKIDPVPQIVINTNTDIHTNALSNVRVSTDNTNAKAIDLTIDDKNETLNVTQQPEELSDDDCIIIEEKDIIEEPLINDKATVSENEKESKNLNGPEKNPENINKSNEREKQCENGNKINNINELVKEMEITNESTSVKEPEQQQEIVNSLKNTIANESNNTNEPEHQREILNASDNTIEPEKKLEYANSDNNKFLELERILDQSFDLSSDIKQYKNKNLNRKANENEQRLSRIQLEAILQGLPFSKIDDSINYKNQEKDQQIKTPLNVNISNPGKSEGKDNNDISNTNDLIQVENNDNTKVSVIEKKSELKSIPNRRKSMANDDKQPKNKISSPTSRRKSVTYDNIKEISLEKTNKPDNSSVIVEKSSKIRRTSPIPRRKSVTNEDFKGMNLEQSSKLDKSNVAIEKSSKDGRTSPTPRRKSVAYDDLKEMKLEKSNQSDNSISTIEKSSKDRRTCPTPRRKSVAYDDLKEMRLEKCNQLDNSISTIEKSSKDRRTCPTPRRKSVAYDDLKEMRLEKSNQSDNSISTIEKSSKDRRTCPTPRRKSVAYDDLKETSLEKCNQSDNSISTIEKSSKDRRTIPAPRRKSVAYDDLKEMRLEKCNQLDNSISTIEKSSKDRRTCPTPRRKSVAYDDLKEMRLEKSNQSDNSISTIEKSSKDRRTCPTPRRKSVAYDDLKETSLEKSNQSDNSISTIEKSSKDRRTIPTPRRKSVANEDLEEMRLEKSNQSDNSNPAIEKSLKIRKTSPSSRRKSVTNEDLKVINLEQCSKLNNSNAVIEKSLKDQRSSPILKRKSVANDNIKEKRLEKSNPPDNSMTPGEKHQKHIRFSTTTRRKSVASDNDQGIIKINDNCKEINLEKSNKLVNTNNKTIDDKLLKRRLSITSHPRKSISSDDEHNALKNNCNLKKSPVNTPKKDVKSKIRGKLSGTGEIQVLKINENPKEPNPDQSDLLDNLDKADEKVISGTLKRKFEEKGNDHPKVLKRTQSENVGKNMKTSVVKLGRLKTSDDHRPLLNKSKSLTEVNENEHRKIDKCITVNNEIKTRNHGIKSRVLNIERNEKDIVKPDSDDKNNGSAIKSNEKVSKSRYNEIYMDSITKQKRNENLIEPNNPQAIKPVQKNMATKTLECCKCKKKFKADENLNIKTTISLPRDTSVYKCQECDRKTIKEPAFTKEHKSETRSRHKQREKERIIKKNISAFKSKKCYVKLKKLDLLKDIPSEKCVNAGVSKRKGIVNSPSKKCTTSVRLKETRKTKGYRCPKCSKLFMTRQCLTKHQSEACKIMHEPRVLRQSANIKSKAQCVSKNELKPHESKPKTQPNKKPPAKDTETNEKSLICSKCKKKFTKAIVLKLHQEKCCVNVNEMGITGLFSCLCCKKQFNNNGELNKHIKLSCGLLKLTSF